MSRGIFKKPEERIRKISENHARYWQNKKHSKEHRQKITDSKKGLKIQKKKYYCIECNKLLFKKAKTLRCASCSKKWQIKNGVKIGFQKGCHINLGIPKSLKTRQKMGKWQKGKSKLHMKGSKHWNWQNGISNKPYHFDFNKELKESIRKRDNYICQKCGIHQNKLKNYHKKLSVHHIDYNKQNSNPTNLISLCTSCHMKTNKNRKSWINYFQKLIKNFLI